MTTQEEQVEETPVTVPAQVVPEAQVTEPKENETPKNEAAVPQSEWQKAQEDIKNLKEENARIAREKFESQNPIVTTEKYKAKWDEAIKQKNTPGHKYQHLELHEILNLIRDPSPAPEPQVAKPILPTFSPSAAPDAPQGEISPQVNDWLSMRYTQEEIAATKKR